MAQWNGTKQRNQFYARFDRRMELSFVSFVESSQVRLHTLQGALPGENVGSWPWVGKPVSTSDGPAVLAHSTPKGLQPPCQDLLDTALLVNVSW